MNDADLLGDQEVDPFSIVRHFAEDQHLDELPSLSGHRSDQKSLRVLKPVSADERIWDSFQDLLHKPWWSRLWCVQECLLSSAAVVVLGRWRIAWKIAKICQTNYQRHASTCCSSISGSVPEKYALYTNVLVDHFYLDSSHHAGVRPELNSNLDLLLRSFTDRQCSDPRDKVYGILGLIDKSRYPDLVVDYTLSTGSVYTGAMKSMLVGGDGDLRCLTGLGLNSANHNLPSWARDFEHNPDIPALSYELARFRRYELYDAAYSTKASPSFHNSNTLSLSGVLVGKIHGVGVAVQSRSWPHVGQVLQQWQDMVGFNDSSFLLEENWRQSEAETFWRMIVADALAEGDTKPRRLSHIDMKNMRLWVTVLVDALRNGRSPHVEEWSKSMFSAIHGRALFLTHQRTIGLCYPESQVGDEVWVLLGSRVPFILRTCQELHQESASIQSDYKLVGSCYLDGYMDGKAIQDASSRIQNIHIR